jgi:hypothetical protein
MEVREGQGCVHFALALHTSAPFSSAARMKFIPSFACVEGVGWDAEGRKVVHVYVYVFFWSLSDFVSE